LDTFRVVYLDATGTAPDPLYPEPGRHPDHGTQIAGIGNAVQSKYQLIRSQIQDRRSFRFPHDGDHFIATFQCTDPRQLVGRNRPMIMQTHELGHAIRGEQLHYLQPRTQRFAYHLGALNKELAMLIAELLLLQGPRMLQEFLHARWQVYLALPFLQQVRQERKIGSTTLQLRFSKKHITPLFALFILASCDSTRRLPPGTYLLNHDQVTITEPSADAAELKAIIKQKPNKRILGIPFYLALYNLRDPAAVMEKRARKDSLCATRNEVRLQAGKRERRCDRTTRGRNGESPVVFDPALMQRSSDQIRSYMYREGWFKAEVSDTVHHTRYNTIFRRRGRPYVRAKVDVEYIVVPGPKYTLRNIRYTVDDPAISGYVSTYWDASLLKSGARFDADVLDKERERIASSLKELGYLFFSKDLIVYTADTAVGEHQVDVTLRLERTYAKNDRRLAGSVEGRVFTIEEVTIHTSRNRVPKDTTTYQGYRILHDGPLKYRPPALTSAIFLLPGQRFRQSDGDYTYRRLSGLHVFDRVELTYDTAGTSKLGLARARIGLIPSKPQSVTLEAYFTNRGGFPGTTVGLGYRHKNLFRSLGYIKAQMNFGFEAQQSFSRSPDGVQGNQGLLNNTFFNTLSFGPEVTIGFPRPFTRFFSKSSGSRMLLNGVFNYQQRPDFTRTLARGSIGLEWNETPTKMWGLYLTDLSVIKIPSKSAGFEEFLVQTNDPVFTNSYTDHLIISIPRVNFTWNTQAEKKRRTNYYLRSTGELAGSAMRAFTDANTLTDSLTGREYRTLFGIRYAEFVKFDNDFRVNRVIHDGSSVAFRFAAGIGVPFGNLEVLPFESSFFGGGANGMRAWRARSLGPGSYSEPLISYDRIGEIRIEANLEYRFKLISYLEGALFTDIGNIWNRRRDERRPGADFEVEDFISELAVGTGIGARLNFDFFIVRFDLGMQTKDPGLPEGERWLFQPKDIYEARLTELTGSPFNYRTQFNFNLGIGYPF